MSIALGRVPKGRLIGLLSDEPLNRPAGRLSDPREHLGARTVLRLLKLDQVLPRDAAHSLAQAVVGEAGVLPSGLDSLRNEGSWRESDLFLESVVDHRER